MNKQENEVTAVELKTEDLDRVAGGVKNADTEAYHAFVGGWVKGFMDAGGQVGLLFGK